MDDQHTMPADVLRLRWGRPSDAQEASDSMRSIPRM